MTGIVTDSFFSFFEGAASVRLKLCRGGLRRKVVDFYIRFPHLEGLYFGIAGGATVCTCPLGKMFRINGCDDMCFRIVDQLRL